jgi:hypothetical protein
LPISNLNIFKFNYFLKIWNFIIINQNKKTGKKLMYMNETERERRRNLLWRTKFGSGPFWNPLGCPEFFGTSYTPIGSVRKRCRTSHKIIQIVATIILQDFSIRTQNRGTLFKQHTHQLCPCLFSGFYKIPCVPTILHINS